jgi:hypothetical protein
MRIGLIGLPNTGKTTVFNALSRSGAEVTAYTGGKAEPNIAVVEVGDQRVSRLSEMYHPRKTTYATFELVDFAGVGKGFSKEGADSEVMKLVKTMDALGMVLRNFPDSGGAAPAPLDEVQTLDDELVLTDLVVTENRLERIDHSIGRGIKDAPLLAEQKALRKVHDQLNAGCPIRDMELTDDEQKLIRGFQFLTAKPLIAILNSDEERFGADEKLLGSLSRSHTAIEFAGTFEMELAQLDESEARAFMQDIGIEHSARDRLTQVVYRILGLISFFTVGEDEVRAWTITIGSTAVQAAGAIHSDLARGFIRAECFTYDDLISAGSEKAVKQRGLLRLEGKDYVVNDGDVLSIRFNV